ncbi:hypothetical protein pdam_00021499, partial [Pocillopora damicornis]
MYMAVLSTYIWAVTLFSVTGAWVDGSYYCRSAIIMNIAVVMIYAVTISLATGIFGLLLSTLMLVCCWLRYHRYHSRESIESAKLGYVPVPGTVMTYGDEYFIHQQPRQAPLVREPPQFKAALEYAAQQHESSRYYPPPYNYIERRT